ncbi:MAG TPA: ribosomal-processing cysteine protease Prp [Bacillota bacterium]|nr:ribosomal-processing cysteine protease Prp [Bacillota bacterium]
MGFLAKDHSGFASAGEDVVCAGISALTFTALLGIEQIAGLPSCYKISKVTIQCNLPDDSSDEALQTARIILATTRLGLIEMAGQYPDNVKVIDEEV